MIACAFLPKLSVGMESRAQTGGMNGGGFDGRVHGAARSEKRSGVAEDGVMGGDVLVPEGVLDV